jgi:hypothetical protein
VSGILNGFYSEIGVVRGKINAEGGYWEARWFEAGLRYGDNYTPASGYVFFYLLGFDSFTGHFYFESDLQNPQEWGIVTRLTYDAPTNDQAWFDTAYALDVSGVYSNSDAQIWFCEYVGVSDPEYDHPYYLGYTMIDNGTVVTGYSEGACAYFTRVCRGNWYNSEGLSGIVIYSLGNANTLRASYYTGGLSANITNQIGDTSKLHEITKYTRLSFNATDEQCHQFDAGSAILANYLLIAGVILAATLLW